MSAVERVSPVVIQESADQRGRSAIICCIITILIVGIASLISGIIMMILYQKKEAYVYPYSYYSYRHHSVAPALFAIGLLFLIICPICYYLAFKRYNRFDVEETPVIHIEYAPYPAYGPQMPPGQQQQPPMMQHFHGPCHHCDDPFLLRNINQPKYVVTYDERPPTILGVPEVHGPVKTKSGPFEPEKTDVRPFTIFGQPELQDPIKMKSDTSQPTEIKIKPKEHPEENVEKKQ